MTHTPLLDSRGVVRLSLFSEGRALPDTVRIVSVRVNRAVNRVPSAKLVISGGNMPNEMFPVSDTDDFEPGAAIKVKAGYGADEETIFEGIVVKHALQITGQNDAILVVECRDEAVKMTVGRRNASHVDQTDSEVIGKLISAHGLSAEVEATALRHPELVQLSCSDWDFMLARADASGLLLVADAGRLSVKAPATSSAAMLKVSYGIDLIDFHAETAASTFDAQGDIDSAALAQVLGLASDRLQAVASLPKEEPTARGTAQQVKRGLSRIRGRMRFRGRAKAVPGGLIEVEGVGKRFSGDVFVSEVTHEITEGNWITEAQFGLSPQWHTERADVGAPPAAGLSSAVEGLQTGVVLKLDGDPLGEQRIQVAVPVMPTETETETETVGVWARLLQFHGSTKLGAFFGPAVGDEVVLGHFGNDPSYPVILGTVYSSKRVPTCAIAAENNTKSVVTRCQSKIEFDEDGKVITITTPGNNKVVLSDEDRSIVLQDQNGNKVELNPGGIVLDSPKDIRLAAGGKITLEAVGAIGIQSEADVTSRGRNIACEAQVGLVARGNASAELSAAGQTVVKGAIVMIN